MATHDETRRPEQIENDIERTRNQMAHTLDNIQKRFSPGQLLDQALGYLDGNGSADRITENLRRFGSNAGNVVKENPIPITLLGIGLTWLAVSGRSGAKGHRRPSRFMGTSSGMEGMHSMHGEIQSSGTQPMGETMGEKLEHAKGTVSETVSHAREKIGEKASQVRHSVGGAMSSAREKAGEVTHRAQDQAVRLGHTVQDQYQHLVQEQPLVLGALGIAIGAALGAAMPRTRMEDEMMGETSDQLIHQARETGREIMHEGAAEVERRPVTAGPMHEGPTEAESSPITAGSMSGEIRRDMERGQTGAGTTAGGTTTGTTVGGTTAGGTTTEGMGGVTRSTGGEAAAGASTSGSPMGERRGSISDRRKGFLAETVGAATRMAPTGERRQGMGDRRLSGSMGHGAGYDSPRTP
ncbi:DUF3618 domain-containing protein [Methylocaldum sp.]|uniref:DUF3618 domain-containing protein n=1 Tax=Methylocaldum sp. TaxID=1969727 RepID=UPI002D3AA9FF|nr:DUF3618 domain-containing protein [Methylocaldum sp.]HYE34250.1 DUF3618 domain-containing protein [Methylocaldum sp.]